MKILVSLILALAVGTAALAQNPPAATPTAPTPSPAIAEMRALVSRISAKLRAGDDTAAALAGEIAEFDALLKKYPEKNDDSAQILMMKAQLFLGPLEDEETGRQLLTQLQQQYPGTKPAAAVDRILEQIEAGKKAKETLAALVGKPAPELDFTWSDKGNLTKLSALKGKVVVLDFWATWCGPCIASFPQVRELAAHYKGSPVEIIGVTSLQGRVFGLEQKPIDVKDDPKREHALMHDFMKAKDVTWSVAFSEQEVFNPDYGIQGIPYVAIIAPDGTVRHAGLHPASPLAEKTEKIDKILKEFNLPTPKA